MIKYFRKFRYDLIEKNKTGKYLKYAVGEIILVVVGILIALSINNWQQERQNKKQEYRYINDLVNDFKQDSIHLEELRLEATITATAKDSIFKVINDLDYQMDSLPNYFKLQWVGYKVFSPSTSTIEEMKSSSHLEIISNPLLRKKIVKMYYEYELFLQDEGLFMHANREVFTIAKDKLGNIDDNTQEEIKVLLEDKRLTNRLRKNFAKGRLKSLNNISEQTTEILSELREFLKIIDR
jgi:hypothetical protein